jgi:hypothetical protein
MIEFFKGLLSSEKIVDAGIAGIDKAIYTGEEKEEDKQKRQAMMLEFVKASAPMEVARRFIAVAVTIAWCVNGAVAMLFLLIGLILDFYGIQHSDIVKPILDFALWYVMPPFTTITGFYFWARMKHEK